MKSDGEFHYRKHRRSIELFYACASFIEKGSKETIPLIMFWLIPATLITDLVSYFACGMPHGYRQFWYFVNRDNSNILLLLLAFVIDSLTYCFIGLILFFSIIRKDGKALTTRVLSDLPQLLKSNLGKLLPMYFLYFISVTVLASINGWVGQVIAGESDNAGFSNGVVNFIGYSLCYLIFYPLICITTINGGLIMIRDNEDMSTALRRAWEITGHSIQYAWKNGVTGFLSLSMVFYIIRRVLTMVMGFFIIKVVSDESLYTMLDLITEVTWDALSLFMTYSFMVLNVMIFGSIEDQKEGIYINRVIQEIDTTEPDKLKEE